MDNEIIWRIAHLIGLGVSVEEIHDTLTDQYRNVQTWEGEFYLSYRAAQVYLNDPIV